MYGIEVAGLVLGALPLVTRTMQMYSIAIACSDEYQSGIYSHKLRRERATFETIVQLLSQSDVTDSEANHEVAESLLRKIADVLDKTTTIFTSVNGKPFDVTTVEPAMDDQGRLYSQIEQISAYNNKLLLLVDQMTDGAALKQVSSAEFPSHSCGQIAKPSGPTGSKIRRQSLRQKGQLLQQLISSCDTLFLLATESQPMFKDAFNKFRLWELDVKCEGLYKAIDLSAPESGAAKTFNNKPNKQAPYSSGAPRPDIIAILFRSVIRIIKVCENLAMQENHLVDSLEWKYALNLCTTLERVACREIPSLNNVHARDLKLTDHTPEERHSIALTTIELVIHTLQSSLPTTTMISRQYSMLQIGDVQASDVTRLLDDSMNLIGSVRSALPRVSELNKARFPRRGRNLSYTTNAGTKYKKYFTLLESLSATSTIKKLATTTTIKNPATKGPGKDSERDQKNYRGKHAATVDSDSIQCVFEKQAMTLENWKAQNTQNIESKLVNNNPAKLASIADSVKNIERLLSNFNGMMKDPDTSKFSVQELQSSMKALETFVESLVAVGSQLNQIYAAPPPDRSDSEGHVLISLTGQRVSAPA